MVLVITSSFPVLSLYRKTIETTTLFGKYAANALDILPKGIVRNAWGSGNSEHTKWDNFAFAVRYLL